ncbi:putative phage abortive infection protein [Achromobacter sp. ES-001]|uniref:putative phage abortive infection protein n=1 Tax=Achromobacter sp. ES-001 TaxID=2860286 RepID=UPI001C64186E|nr:putative phage abortive infection protein [Achromobacter sp. ES-001]QYJ23420.1 putative phage abortive infection protein [Achromobacter sp. ES-001]
MSVAESRLDQEAEERKKAWLAARKKAMRWMKICVSVPAIVAAIAYFTYRSKFDGALSAKHDDWGQLGDFFGGLLNPVVGVVTLILLLRTLMSQQDAIWMQSEELALQRRELKLQREETTKSTAALDAQHKAIVQQNMEQSLFTWLNSYKALVREFSAPKKTERGTALLEKIVETFSDTIAFDQNFTRGFNWPWLLNPGPGAIQLVHKGDVKTIKNFIEALRRAKLIYQDEFRQHESELGAMLRTLYRLLSWIDKAELDDEAVRWDYMAIVRAQLSQSELILIAYNGIFHERLAALANKYALFDNLNVSDDNLLWSFKNAFGTEKFNQEDTGQVLENWPYLPEAFDSDKAKPKLVPKI